MPGNERRPRHRSAAANTTSTDQPSVSRGDALPYRRRFVGPAAPWHPVRAVAVRRAASRREQLLACGRHRDPLDHAAARDVGGPETFGLTTEELRREANRLYTLGWPTGEIVQTLAVDVRSDVV